MEPIPATHRSRRTSDSSFEHPRIVRSPSSESVASLRTQSSSSAIDEYSTRTATPPPSWWTSMVPAICCAQAVRTVEPQASSVGHIIMPCIIACITLLYLLAFVHETQSFIPKDSPASHIIVVAIEHLASTSSLLNDVHIFIAPELDHVSLRSLRDTAGRVGLEGMRDKLDVLAEQVMKAKMLSLTFGAEIWMSSVFTHAELSSAIDTSNTANSMSNAHHNRLALALANRSLAMASLQQASRQLHDALLTANALGTSILWSTEWNELLVSIDKRRRRRQLVWTNPNDPVWKSDSNLLAATAVVARCSLLSDAVLRTRTLLQFTLDILSQLTSANKSRAISSYLGDEAQAPTVELVSGSLADLLIEINRTRPTQD